ncbi:Rv3235 family protein [Actinophytocola sp.]|uniref:Rv3235 family protein n=1 Tax=Actinophytocola sp. TaxID=1872138 RepID=UPI003D6C5D38
MTAPVRYLPAPRPVLRALPEYEPSHAPGEEEPRRWSSLRPASGPQLALVAPPRQPEVTPDALWRLLVRVLEVLEGRRAVGQLRTLLSDAAYEALLTRLRTTTPGRPHRLRRLRACYPSPAAVEIAAVIDIGPGPAAARRVCALAARLDHVDGTWHCSVLRLL